MYYGYYFFILPFILFLLIPIVSSLNILINFKRKKIYSFHFTYSRFFLLLCQLINFLYVQNSELFFQIPSGLFF